MRASISSLLLLVAIAGCGDDEDEGRPRYRSDVSVSTDTSVADLDDEELRRICASVDAHVSGYVDLSVVAYVACLPQAILTSADRDQCEAQFDRCVDDFPKPIAINARFEDDACIEGLRLCDATVADLDTCLNLNFDVVYSIVDTLSCGGTSEAEAREAMRRANDVHLCADVSAACDDFANVRGPD